MAEGPYIDTRGMLPGQEVRYIHPKTRRERTGIIREVYTHSVVLDDGLAIGAPLIISCYHPKAGSLPMPPSRDPQIRHRGVGKPLYRK